MKLTPLSAPPVEWKKRQEFVLRRKSIHGFLRGWVFKSKHNGSEEGTLLRKARQAEGWPHQSRKTVEIQFNPVI